MNALDRLASAGSNSVGQYTFIDADTIRDTDGASYRLQGYDAPEIAGFKGGRWDTGTAGAADSTRAITALAREQGYNNVVKTGKFDPNGREIIELHDENGNNFTTKLLESGVLQAGKYTEQDDLDAIAVANLWKDENEGTDEWGQAATTVADAIAKEGGDNLRFKQAALNEAHYAAAPHLFTSAVQFRKGDRTIDNVSLNPFSDSWEQGWIGVKEASYGMLNLFGETTDIEWAAEVGDAGIERARKDLRSYGSTLTDWKEVRDVGTAFQYVTNNAALSLPYMAISVGGAVAAPFTAGASLAAPASIYAGQTWNEMEGDKNAGIAIASGVAQAALDRLGLGFIVGKAGKVGGTKLLDDAVAELVKRGDPEDVAKKKVLSATRRELAGFVGDAATIAKQQITGKQVFKKLMAGTAISSGGEAVTEALQETTGYLAAVAGSDKQFDYNDLIDRAMAGAIAGAALGGAFSTPTTLYDVGAWADVAVRSGQADPSRLSNPGKWAEQEISSYGRVSSNEENALNAKTRARSAAANTIPTMEERSEVHKQSRRGRSASDQITDIVTSTPSLWRGATRWIFKPEILERSRSARMLADMFGGQLQRTFSGSNFENAKHHGVTTYKNMVDIPDRVYAKFNNGKRTSRKQREAISAEIYRTLNSAIDPDTKKFNPNLIPDTNPHKDLLVDLQGQLARLGDKMYSDQKRHNPELGYLSNYLMRYKSFNKKAIVDNRTEFIHALQDEFNMSERDAADIADAITSSTEINDISDALEGSGAAGKPSAHKSRTLDLSERDRFQKFMNQDIFANIADAAKSAARYNAYQEYIGNNNEVINQMLADIEAETGDTEAVNRMAKQIQDYLAAESGNYKRPKPGTALHRLQTAQRSFMMAVTFAALPLATISSFVEVMLTMRGLTVDQIFGKGGSLQNLGNELGKTLWTGMKEVQSLADNKQVLPPATKGKDMIANLGFYDWDVGAATTTGVTETQPWRQSAYENFFKWTGLQGWTNFTRAARASIAGDYITDKLDILFNNTDNTNEVQEAREGLRNLGINVEDVLAAYDGQGNFDPAMADVLERNFREGVFNFINEAVALPQAQNRPLIYQDPRFALFTQFQGFIATFTANHIPRLWGEYVKRGTPAMKYNAFAVMTTMIMMGFASQYLKDLIKYGELREFGPEEHPFLNTSEYIQRGVRASGLLGTGERVLDQFFPLYDKRSDSTGEWLFNAVTGESPALGAAGRLAGGVGKGITGDVGGAAKEAVRFTPFVGPLNVFRDYVQDKASAWNFSGE